MKSFKLSPNGDLTMSNGDLVMIEGDSDLVQSIERILSTNTSEWFLDTEFGLDYSELEGKGKLKDNIKLVITEAIFQESRIEQVDIRNVLLRQGRHLVIDGVATDVDGNVLDLSRLEVQDIG